jgi:hypothetical protein
MKKILLSVSIVFLLTSFKPKQITWVAIGDSITYLNDHADETGEQDLQRIYDKSSGTTTEHTVYQPGP